MNRFTRAQARRSVFLTAGFRLFSQFCTFASYVVLVRALSEHDFGILNLLYAVIPVISTAASFGIEQTLRRFQPEYLKAGNPGVAHLLLRLASRVRLGSNLLLLGLLWLLWRWVAPWFGLAPYRSEFTVFAVLILLHFQASIVRISLSSHMLQGFAVGFTILLSLTKLLAYAFLAWSGQLTLLAAICTDLAGYTLMYVALRVAHAWYCADTARDTTHTFEPDERRRLLRYAAFNNFNDAGTVLLTSKSDTFFIAALMSTVAVGAYAFYTRLNEMVSLLLPTRQLGEVIQPLFFSVLATEARDKVPRYFTLLLNASFAVQLPLTIYAVAYHSEIVDVVFDGKFRQWSWLLPVVAGFSALNRIAEPVTLVAQQQERAKLIFLSKAFGLYNAAAILILTPLMGLLGVACATGSAQLMKNLFIWWHVRSIARWLNARQAIAMNLIVGGGAILICLGVKQALALPSIAHLLFGGLVCLAAAYLYLRSPAISGADRDLLGSVFSGRERHLLSWIGVRPARTEGAS